MSTDRLHQPIVTAAVDRLTSARTNASDAPARPTLEQLLAVCAEASATVELGEKWRWRIHEAARLTAAYLRFLQPPDGWHRRDPVGEASLVWTDGGETFADVLVAGQRGAAVWTRHRSGLPRRTVSTGRAELGDGFVGVRLVALAAPARSLLVTDPTAQPAPLTTTAYWFHDTPLASTDLAAAAAGGQVAS